MYLFSVVGVLLYQTNPHNYYRGPDCTMIFLFTSHSLYQSLPLLTDRSTLAS